MAGVVGCIDGTHIRIVKPKNHEKAYVNRKNYHSLNVQVNLWPSYRFLYVILTILHLIFRLFVMPIIVFSVYVRPNQDLAMIPQYSKAV